MYRNMYVCLYPKRKTMRCKRTMLIKIRPHGICSLILDLHCSIKIYFSHKCKFEMATFGFLTNVLKISSNLINRLRVAHVLSKCSI